MYNREEALKERLNTVLNEVVGKEKRDYCSSMSFNDLLCLKTALSDVNNVITLRLTLSLVDWIGETFKLTEEKVAEMKQKVLSTKPNANGYDVDCNDPDIVAEVKCNIPINKGSTYGADQKKGLLNDIQGLLSGKNKASLRDASFRFLALYNKQSVKEATKHLVHNLPKELHDRIDVHSGSPFDIKTANRGVVHIIYLDV